MRKLDATDRVLIRTYLNDKKNLNTMERKLAKQLIEEIVFDKLDRDMRRKEVK